MHEEGGYVIRAVDTPAYLLQAQPSSPASVLHTGTNVQQSCL